MNIELIWPPYSLHLRSGDMELSPVREGDLPELAQIAKGGVRRDGIEAFLIDWDSGSDEEVARSLAQYHWATRANFTVDEWTIEFTVRVGGRVVGIQGVNGSRYPLTRTVSTGSWLAKKEQGRGFGTKMRSMVVSTFIEHFGAGRFETAYIAGNDASRRVSEKLGYSPNGDHVIIAQQGRPRTENKMVLRAEDFRSSVGEVQVAGAEAVRSFLGIET
ncbi:GNAT family N-acetyltransferase [Brevibacterium spongiae]|uniref:GNAT family N-acetyltransferase n=1 Tax=Brevibacterium spongiae TaxID=2909672 RepID=A0ABY5SVX2_9MICO|nr:GNAT family protein [Brevibacterium spongiae]UVI37246.1 GNAT family N-acetyltransferase [Brevibacterium spongiae]